MFEILKSRGWGPMGVCKTMALVMATTSIWVLFWIITLIPTGTFSQNLNSSISLSQLIAANPPTSTRGNVNIVSSVGDENSDPTPVCYLPYLFSLSNGGTPWNNLGEYDGLAAILLALEHLNTGNGTIVKQLDGIHDTCPLRFTTKVFDTESLQSVGVKHTISLTDRSKTQQLFPCAILGASYSSISIPTSIISGIQGVPQISPISTSASLDDTERFRLFGRTIPNDDGTAIPLLAKLSSWGVDHIAVLHLDEIYGNSYANGIRFAAEKQTPNLQVVTVGIVFDADDDKISEAIRKLKDTEFTFFFGIIHPDISDRIMTEAYKQGIAGTGWHTWLFSDSVGNSMTGRNFQIGSPLEKAHRGSGTLTAVGGVPGMDLFDKLTSSLQQLGQNDIDMTYMYGHLPQEYSDGKFANHSIITAQESFLKVPGLIAPFLYDAVIALGLASCELVEISQKDEYFTGEELFQAFVNTTFEGASGSVVLHQTTGTRNPWSTFFSLTNIVADENADVNSGMVQFKGVGTDLFKSGKWESLFPYTFNDGTSDIPLDLPALETETNYLDMGLKVVGLILCGIIVALAFGFSYWTYHNSRKRVVRASQPIFLHMISGGTLLMGLAIIPLTIDLGVATKNGADAACMSICWLLAVGFSLTFSALFTKTYRINQLMGSAAKFKRMKVTSIDVMKPMVVLLILNIIVLTVWTAVDPLQRNCVVVHRDQFGRIEESYGICSSEHASIFSSILCVINLGSLLVALCQAYRARNISTEFQESSYIFMAMTLVLLASFIGIPVIFIARDNTAAYYFLTAGLIFVVCSSVLLLIFVPKCRALRNEESTRASAVADGIQILNTKMAHDELERENSKLRRENLGLIANESTIRDATSRLEKENDCLKQSSCHPQLSLHQSKAWLSQLSSIESSLSEEQKKQECFTSIDAHDLPSHSAVNNDHSFHSVGDMEEARLPM